MESNLQSDQPDEPINGPTDQEIHERQQAELAEAAEEHRERVSGDAVQPQPVEVAPEQPAESQESEARPPQQEPQTDAPQPEPQQEQYGTDDPSGGDGVSEDSSS
jgi:hypothetical protein